MAQADSTTTALFKPPGESPDELTRVSEIIRASGIPVADSLKDEMYTELVRLTQEGEDTAYCGGQRRSA